MTIASFFNLDFWQQLATTTAGVAFGIPVALWIERCIKSRRDTEDRKSLVRALESALTKNLELVKHLSENLSPARIAQEPAFTPLYPMDLTILDSTSSRKYELLHAGDTATAIDHARFEIIRIDCKLTVLREITGRLGDSRGRDTFFRDIKNSIYRDIPTATESLEAALKFLREEAICEQPTLEN